MMLCAWMPLVVAMNFRQPVEGGLAPLSPVVDMIRKFDIVDPNRLAISPILDGRFENEEWDLLHQDAQSPVYMQWEPGALYLASKVPVGKDIVFSLDLKGDGWLIGSDNLELRASWGDGAPKVTARTLDGNNRTAPLWSYAPMTEALTQSAGMKEGDFWTLEMKVQTVDLPDFVIGRTLGIRADVIGSGSPTPEPFSPRNTSLVALRWERAHGLPEGMEWAPEYKVRSVVPGESIKIRLTFTNHGKGDFRRAELRSEGIARDSSKLFAVPFPQFDRKGRSFIDYDTSIASDAIKGFRVLHAHVSGVNGEDATIQSSYQISDVVDFEPSLPDDLVTEADSRIVRGNVIVRSNTSNKLRGTFEVGVPESWSVSKGKTQKFLIYNNRGYVKLPFELIAPQRAQGLVPIDFKATIGDKIVKRTVMLPIR